MGSESWGVYLHERPLPFSGYEEGKERCGDAVLSCGATDGKATPRLPAQVLPGHSPAVAAIPWVQVIQGGCLGVEVPPRLSVLKVPPAAHSQERVSKETEGPHRHHQSHSVSLS